MNLRSHQLQMQGICREILNGAPVKRIIAAVTPGGGKSLLPVIAAHELIPRAFKRLCWLVPRVALQNQAETAFMWHGYPYEHTPNSVDFGRVKTRSIRASTNQSDPCRGRDGFVTTYAALALDHKNGSIIASEFKRHSYILVLDEPQFIAADSATQKAVAPLLELAGLTIFMSGTFERGAGDKLAFLPYSPQDAGSEVLTLDDDSKTRTIHYSRSDALKERAIIPVNFHFLDAKASWVKEGRAASVESLRGMDSRVARSAIYTTLRTQYAKQLLRFAGMDWRKHRGTNNPNAKLLIVASTQALAREYATLIRDEFCPSCDIATIDEGPRALKAIKRFKSEKGTVLVTVGMASIGLDVPEITHLCCLTHIRSKPWIEQMIARATRHDPRAGPWEQQEAHVYMPDDPLMHNVIRQIRIEQLPFVKHGRNENDFYYRLGRDLFGNVIPVSSDAGERRSVPLSPRPETLVPSEQESAVRQRIEGRVRAYALRRKIDFKNVNGRIRSAFGKSRDKMTLVELETVEKWCKENLK